jgi:hypothetical protein
MTRCNALSTPAALLENIAVCRQDIRMGVRRPPPSGTPQGRSNRLSRFAAASAKAHVREAWPDSVPGVSPRVSADSMAHVTKRKEETSSCTRGHRAP